MSRCVYPDQEFRKPNDITIPKSDAIVRKVGRCREDATPNSVAFMSASRCPTKEMIKIVLETQKEKPISSSQKRKEWRCSSPTDRYNAEIPFSILKRNYVQRYIEEANGNLAMKA